MKREERQRRILALLDKEWGISAGDLSRRLQVSRMTIHRDLQSLFSQGGLLRIRGGAVAKGTVHMREDRYCTVCSRTVLPHQKCEILKNDGSLLVTCCAACALRQILTLSDVERFLVADQISGCLLPAEEAFFLVNSLASPCCQPSFLSFLNENEIALFQVGFGGSIARLSEALEFLRVADGLGLD